MTRAKDDWPKPRGKADHLTAAELAQVKAAFAAGQTAVETARAMQCTSSTMYVRFKLLREGPPAIKVLRFRPDRSYRSNHKQHA